MDFPTLSLAERDRRWAMAQQALVDHDLDGLLLFGLRARERTSGYLANEHIEGAVIMARGRDPVQVFPSAQGYSRRMSDNFAPDLFWIKRYIAGPLAVKIPLALAQEGLDAGKIGVFGVHNTYSPGEAQGYVPHGLWHAVLTALPDAQFSDATDLLHQLMQRRSAEEVVMIRHSAAIAEAACARMLDVVRPGVTEAEIYAEICHEIHKRGAFTTHPRLVLSVGAGDVGWTAAAYFYASGAGRSVQPGDLVQAEIFATYGGFESQAQMSVALKPVAEELHDLAQIARQSYDAGIGALRAGADFAAVDAAMKAPLLAHHCYSLGPQIHSLSPTRLSGEAGINVHAGCHPRFSGFTAGKAPAADQIPDGSVFSFQPNAARRDARVNLGGIVLVQGGTVEELSQLPCQMNVKG